MAKRSNQMSYGQRKKYGPREIPQASNKSDEDLKKLQDIYQKSKQEAEAKKVAKAKKKIKEYKYKGPSGVQAEFGSIEMFRNKKAEQRRETVLSMFRRILELQNAADKDELEKLLKLQPNSFQTSSQYAKLYQLTGGTEQSILEANVDDLEKYFMAEFNVLSMKTIYKDQRERLIEERERENEFIKSSYKASKSNLSFEEYKDEYFRMKGIIIDRLKILKDSGEAVQKFNEFITNTPNFNESDIENLANRIASDIDENAEKQLELNRRAAVERAEKRAYRNMSVQDKVVLSQIKQLGRDYSDMYEEYLQQGPSYEETFDKYVKRIYESKVNVGEIKEIKLKVDPSTLPYLRSYVKSNEPGDVFELKDPRGSTYYYVIERHDQHKSARMLDLNNPVDMDILNTFESRNITDDIDFRIEKPIVSNTGSISLPNDEDMGDLF